ncbi:MAG TPA: PAS domain-containing protein, partial [Burkholderiaceae bacterium]|nr:PAS domain-containing protein [Burkholderiaceae bacterium]
MTADSRPTPKKTTLAAASISDLSSSLFDTMPMALWLEDYSALRQQFEEWRQQGVTNLRSFLEGDQQHMQRCAESIQVLRVNQATLDLYGAQNVEELQAHLADVLRDETYEAFISELEQLWNGDSAFQSRTVNYTLDGERLDLSLKAVVLPGHEADWSRVLVVVDDITELASLYRRLIKEEAYARGVFEQSPVSLWVEDFSVIKQLL